jgi:hypothetical protein
VPALPAEDAFVARMPVSGYWDDHLEPLKAAHIWSIARFNSRYRKIEFPLGDTPPDASLLFLQGIGWYRKVFDATAGWGRRLVTLHVGGMRQEAWAWINWNFAGHHYGASTPFELSLGKWVRAGAANTLVIAVSNSREDRGGSSLNGDRALEGGGVVSLAVAHRAEIADGSSAPAGRSMNIPVEKRSG